MELGLISFGSGLMSVHLDDDIRFSRSSKSGLSGLVSGLTLRGMCLSRRARLGIINSNYNLDYPEGYIWNNFGDLERSGKNVYWPKRATEPEFMNKIWTKKMRNVIAANFR